MQSTFLFVINPISGGKQKNEHEAAINKYFSQLPHKIDFFFLDGKNDAAELDGCISKLQPQKVVAVGGDGTISMVAKKILDTDMQLGIVPAGSANGIAAELNIPVDVEQALGIVEKGVVKKADVIKINDEISLHLSDIGLNARLIKYFEESNMRGKWGYAKIAFKLLFRKQNIRVIITAKDREIKRDAFMVVLANASKYGTGAVINPRGNIFDGIFEVVVIRQLGLYTLLKVWFRPQAFDPKKIEVIEARSVHIETQRKVHFQVDGEYVGKVKSVEARILPAKLNILLPE